MVKGIKALPPTPTVEYTEANMDWRKFIQLIRQVKPTMYNVPMVWVANKLERCLELEEKAGL